MKSIAALILILVAQLITLQAAHAQLQFLECDIKNMNQYREQCQVATECGIMDQVRTGASSRDALLNNRCFSEKAMACYCLTFEGARAYDTNDFNFTDVAVYGNFCGWRNAAKAANGSGLDWTNKTQVSKNEKALQPVDALDQICKVHDHDYTASPDKICRADRKAIKAMHKLALDKNNGLSDSVREQALAMAESLYKNRVTCNVLDLIR